MKKLFLLLFCSSSLFALEETTSSAVIKLENDKGFYANGHFLYWVAQEEGLFFGQNVNYSVNASHDVVLTKIDGSVKRAKPDWSCGFRIGLGYNWDYDAWNSDLKWTYFHSEAKGKTDNMTMTLIGHPSRQVADFSLDAKASWHFHYNLIDLDTGRNSVIGKHFSLRPFGGLRGVFVKQTYRVNYHCAQYHPGERTPVRSIPIIRCDFDGMGLKGGTNGSFSFNSSWSISTEAMLSLFYGRFSCPMKTFERAGADEYTVATTQDKFWQAVFTPSLAVALKYGTFFGNKKYFVAGSVGWEQSVWFGLNKMVRYVHKFIEGKMYQMNDNLTLQGLICSLQMDF